MKNKALVFMVGLALPASVGVAQTAFDASSPNGGSMSAGYDSRTCDGAIEGAIRFNSADSQIEVCDGSNWNSWGG